MAIRKVDTDLWNDPLITDDFNWYDKYFWLFLLTTRYGNLTGCFEITPKQMQVDLGLPLEKVKEQIERFVEYGLIDYDFNLQEVLIVNYAKHNWSKSESLIKAVKKYVVKIKNPNFKNYILNMIEYYEDLTSCGDGGGMVSTPLYSIIPTSTPTSIDLNSINNQKKDKDSPKEKKEKNKYGEFNRVLLTDEEFEKLQKLFPDHYHKYLQNLDYYLESSNKRYKSHYAVIRQWLSRDGIKEQEDLEWHKMTQSAAETLAKMRGEKNE